VNRVDPENREFKHPDPIHWTDSHRVEILRALYTILLGNPHLDAAREAPTNTRFKMWWRLVGGAIEHAAEAAGAPVDFQKLFLQQDEDDVEAATLGDMLVRWMTQWETEKIKAKDVADFVNNSQGIGGCEVKSIFFDVLYGKPVEEVGRPSPRSVGHRLNSVVGAPVLTDDGIYILRSEDEKSGGGKPTKVYWIELIIEGELKAVCELVRLLNKNKRPIVTTDVSIRQLFKNELNHEAMKKAFEQGGMKKVYSGRSDKIRWTAFANAAAIADKRLESVIVDVPQ
jgi:hypothetical protein